MSGFAFYRGDIGVAKGREKGVDDVHAAKGRGKGGDNVTDNNNSNNN